jgi:hypothetical protein
MELETDKAASAFSPNAEGKHGSLAIIMLISNNVYFVRKISTARKRLTKPKSYRNCVPGKDTIQ